MNCRIDPEVYRSAPVAEEALSLLAVTSELPWPLNSGGHLRTFHLLRALATTHRVRLVTAVPSGQEEAVERLRQQGIQVCPARVRARTLWREALRAAGAAVRREPYVLYRRHDRAAVRSVLREQLRREPPNVGYLDHLDSMLFQPLLAGIPFLVDLHNVYSTLARREAESQARPWVRLYLRREARLLERMERQAASRADALLTVSEEEQRHFRALGARAVYLVPNGVDCSAYEALPAGRSPGRPIILYIGTLSWPPNAEAAYFLADQVLPRVRARLPEARVQLIGRNPPAQVQALSRRPGVEVLGGVPDVVPYLREAHVLAVPLEAGGGTRLKILEAFAAGLPTVSTPVGCEGLRGRHGEHLLITSRERFAEAILSLLQDEALGRQLAVRARALAQEQYDWRTVGASARTAVAEVGRYRRLS